ncbi:MAG: phosphatase PAP2 family protein [Anaerolineae bacterium]|jgi:undecaprenyl-diphosphatase
MRRALERLIAWDQALTARLTLPPTPATHLWRLLANVMAHTGDSVAWLIWAALAYALGQGSWVQGGERVFLGTICGGAATWLLKQVFRRRRPSDETHKLYLSLDVHSFPSGHAGRGACNVTLLLPLLPWPLQIGLLLWLGLMALSRVAMGIHYVSDVLVGFIVGGSIGWGISCWLTS